MSVFEELKRRNVYRVAALYIIVSWLVLQVADVFMSFLPLPEWTPNLVFVLLVLGFPVALVLAWAFELTPDGLQRERHAGSGRESGSAFRRTDLLIAAALIGICAYVLLGRHPEEPTVEQSAPRMAPGPIDSIVVLPLEDLTGDPSQAFFVAGMHEALITELSKVEALRVISRTSAMAYQDSAKPLPQIARELNVDAVVEGSVLRAGDTVRVTAQLIEAASDRHLWAENFDRKNADILALYGDVAQAIVEHIRVKVTPEEAVRLARERTVDPAAYEIHLQSRYLCDNWSPTEMKQGIELARQVTVMDPAWAPAQAVLSLCLQYAAFFNYLRPMDIMEESLAAAERALELDEELAEAHVAMAGNRYYLQYNREAGERQLRRALELNPGSVRALIHLSWLLGEAGRVEEGLPITRKAMQYDPLNTVASHALGQLYMLARRREEALSAYQSAAELDPRDPYLQFSVSLEQLELGQAAAALETMRGAVQLSEREPLYLAGLVYTLARTGHGEEARQVREELASGGQAAPFALALADLGIGDRELAIQELVQAYEERNSQIVYLAEWSIFDPLRDSPDFQELLRRLGW